MEVAIQRKYQNSKHLREKRAALTGRDLEVSLRLQQLMSERVWEWIGDGMPVLMYRLGWIGSMLVTRNQLEHAAEAVCSIYHPKLKAVVCSRRLVLFWFEEAEVGGGGKEGGGGGLESEASSVTMT
jgi:hypothetical protein